MSREIIFLFCLLRPDMALRERALRLSIAHEKSLKRVARRARASHLRSEPGLSNGKLWVQALKTTNALALASHDANLEYARWYWAAEYVAHNG